MAYDGSIIKAPVAIRDVQLAMGYSRSGDLADIITNSSINKWAKFKPFRYPDKSLLPETDATGYPQPLSRIGSHHRSLQEANCGLGVNWSGKGRRQCIKGTLTIMASGNDDEIWSYNRPRGGENEPYRLQDFCGYFAEARPFIWQNNQTTKIVADRGEVDDSRDIQFTLGFYSDDNETVEGQITVDDLKGGQVNCSNLYYAVAICNPKILDEDYNDQYVLGIACAEQPIEDTDGQMVTFSLTQFRTWKELYHLQDYTAIHMLSVGRNTGTYMEMPYSADYPPVTTIKVQSAATPMQIYVEAIADWTSTAQGISSLTFNDVSGNVDVRCFGWTGITAKVSLTTSSEATRDVTVNFGQVYAQTNMSEGAEAVELIVDSDYDNVTYTEKDYDNGVRIRNKQITMPPGIENFEIYLTFPNILRNAQYGDDIELTIWGESGSGQATLNAFSAGNDGSILYI